MVKKVTFRSLDLSQKAMSSLEKAGFIDLTPIQEQTFDILASGKDLLGEAPTGTGKTAAYFVPSMDKIDDNEILQMLILVPTRELALQSVEEINKLSTDSKNIHCISIYGGQPIQRQLKLLKERPNIIVATPGRLLDHIDRHSIRLDNISILVLDECDEMLNMGFRPDINKILSNIKRDHQTILFSATVSNEIRDISTKYQHDAEYIVVKRDLSKFKNINQNFIEVKEEEKPEVLHTLLSVLTYSKIFVFCRTKHKVNKLYKVLYKEGFSITYLHGDLKQNKRDIAMNSFRNGEAKILLTTDIAARGIDVKDVDAVINYDVPEEDEFYIHRIGRTGRIDKKGNSFVFLTKTQVKKLLPLYEKMTDDKIKEYTLPSVKEQNNMSAKNKLIDVKEITKENLKEYKDLISETLNEWKESGDEIDTLTLAAALLRSSVNLEKRNDIATKGEKKESSHHERSERSSSSFKTTSDDNQRFFINVGSDDGVDNDGLKHFICKYCANISEADFADTYVKGRYSFFELPKDKVEGLIETLSAQSFGERKVNVEISEPKSSSGKGSERRGGGNRRGGSYSHKPSFGHSGSFHSHGGDRKSYGEHKSFNEDNDSFSSPSYGKSDRNEYGDKPARRSYSDRKSYGDRSKSRNYKKKY